MTIELQPEFPHRTRRKEKLSPAAQRPVRASGPVEGVWGNREFPPARKGASYVELHAHSSYSFLDGASLPEELAVRAAELGYDALALTDHDGLYGSLEFAHRSEEHTSELQSQSNLVCRLLLEKK